MSSIFPPVILNAGGNGVFLLSSLKTDSCTGWWMRLGLWMMCVNAEIALIRRVGQNIIPVKLFIYYATPSFCEVLKEDTLKKGNRWLSLPHFDKFPLAFCSYCWIVFFATEI